MGSARCKHLIRHHFTLRKPGDNRRIAARSRASRSAFSQGFSVPKSVSGRPRSFLEAGIESTRAKNDARHAFAALTLTLKELEARQKKPGPRIGSTKPPA